MYYGWTTTKKEYKGDNKYFPLIKKEAIGIAKKNDASLPLYQVNDQLIAIRNFGKSKISGTKLTTLIKERKIIVIGGPCLFSRSNLGITHDGIFYSLATPEDREKIPWQETDLELKIGNSITEYHKRHITFMQKAICQIKNTVGKELVMKVIIPCIEYTAYLPHFLQEDIKTKYWEKIRMSSEEIENLYREKLSPMGALTVMRKHKWDVPEQENIPRDLQSYAASYLHRNSDELIIAIEDITETPLLINVGRQTQFLIGVLGILCSLQDIEKEEETHPYLL